VIRRATRAVVDDSAPQPSGPSEILLRLDGVTVTFGGVHAVREVSLTLRQGEILSLVGPNGAGKTSLLNAISGLVRVGSGQMSYGDDQVPLHKLPAHSRASLGIARTFQDTRLFEGLTLLDQLLCGAYVHSRYSLPGTLIRTPGVVGQERARTAEALGILDRLGLLPYAAAPTSAVPGSLARLGDVARALMTRPRLLLLDEIAAGLTDDEKQNVVDVIRGYQEEQGFAVVLIEHDLNFIRALAENVVVLVEGQVLVAGPTNDVLDLPQVLAAYIGE
jgi:ABC-type branched-subunit amino acid transport system ATPase component